MYLKKTLRHSEILFKEQFKGVIMVKITWTQLLCGYLIAQGNIKIYGDLCVAVRLFMEEHHVDPIYGYPITGNTQLTAAVQLLHDIGFIISTKKVSPTANATAFYAAFPDWASWPIISKFNTKINAFDNALFAREEMLKDE